MPAKPHLQKDVSQLAKLAAAAVMGPPQQAAQPAPAPVALPMQLVPVPKLLRPATPPSSTLNPQPHPTQLMDPSIPQVPQKVAEIQDCLMHLRKELQKRAFALGDKNPYTAEQIERITSSAEAFEKAAQEEAQCVWAGIEDTLRKEGADEDFIEGIKKEAWIRQTMGAMGTGIKNALPVIGKALGRGVEHGLTASALGGLVGGVPGALAGGAFGGLGGSLGYGKATLLAGGGLAGGAMLANNLLWDSGKDITGNPANRNRALPFVPNKVTGAAGGAMLGGMLANELGMSGPAAWLMPVLGGLGGYHHLPNLMDKWKDPYGYGANAISSGAASMNRSMPLVN